MTRSETLTLPFGELLDLIAIEQIKREGARLKPSQESEEAAFFSALEYV